MMIAGLYKEIKKLSEEAQQAIVRSVLDVVPGTEFVKYEQYEERLAICNKCEELNEESRKCKMCGCFVDEKTRVKRLPFSQENEHCPLKKW